MVKSFEKILELVQTMNSDKETKLKDYQNKINYYKTNSTKFMAILKGKKPDQWELEANKIIKGNVYLAKKWALDKLQFSIDQNVLKIKSAEMSDEEEKNLNNSLIKDRLTLQKNKQALDKQIHDDLTHIQTL